MSCTRRIASAYSIAKKLTTELHVIHSLADDDRLFSPGLQSPPARIFGAHPGADD